ncbi:N-6 DNA methylase [Caballeronia grimmiae]|uniref:N-6 DNA methylase n=2 Tax=Caballeronia TaxID=1827195 RepID=UPI001FD2675C|nr:N-6 DNA methylase [Caballeronia grimmiae]
MGSIVSNHSTKAVKSIARELDDGYRHRPGEMMRFFLAEILVTWGFKPWMTVPDDVRSKIARAISAYDAAIAEEEPFFDILGPLYQELASHGGKQLLGQFFSPWPLAALMATITEPWSTEIDAGRLAVACDPACGSGIMMLATAHTILNAQGPAALKSWSFVGCDIDGICARMMAIQFLANCAVHRIEVGEVIVFCGDSLRVDQPKEIVVHASAPGIKVAPANAPYRQAMLRNAAQSAGVVSENA